MEKDPKQGKKNRAVSFPLKTVLNILTYLIHLTLFVALCIWTRICEVSCSWCSHLDLILSPLWNSDQIHTYLHMLYIYIWHCIILIYVIWCDIYRGHHVEATPAPGLQQGFHEPPRWRSWRRGLRWRHGGMFGATTSYSLWTPERLVWMEVEWWYFNHTQLRVQEEYTNEETITNHIPLCGS